MISFGEHINAAPGVRVAVGMSGGVDSSVTALMLMEAGFEVCGVTCLFADDAHAHAAVHDARAVAASLGIAHETRDCTQAFSCNVVDAFVDSYARGLTPSPCVVCNKTCKIPSLIAAADDLGCDFVATGHYARVVSRAGRLAAARAAYAPKDQSYMLSMLAQDQLARLMLPLGSLREGKPEVRAIAARHGLAVASKSDSQDICFIHGSHLDFLEERGVVAHPGDIVDLQGRRVGRHAGLFRYTIGQRKGLDIGGAPEPYYVVAKRPEENELVVAFARDAAIDGVVVGGVRWQGASPDDAARLRADGNAMPCAVKLRYRQQATACCIAPADAQGRAMPFAGRSDVRREAGLIAVMLDTPQPTTAPGQFAVFYDDDVVMCAGVIEQVVRCADRSHRA